MFSCEFCESFKNTYFKEHLRTAGSKTLLRGFLFNKITRLMAWRHLTVLERDSSTGVFLKMCNFKESFFVEHLLANFSCIMFLLSLFLQINEVWSLKSICLVNNGKLGERIHKPVSFCVFCVCLEIRWKVHSEVVATHVPT